MANYDESDEDIFITQSSYSDCSAIGSDSDEVLNDVLELEASKSLEARSKCEQILSKKSLIAMDNKELSESLSYFIVEVRNEAGGEYRPNTIYELIISIQYYMRKNGKSVNFLEDEVFAKMRSV